MPKYRKKTLYGQVRKELGKILRDLCWQKNVELLEGHLCPDHVHMLLRVPPKYSIAMIIGFLKGKSAVLIHREKEKLRGCLRGRSFWARGYNVSTVGLNEEQIRKYIQEQEKHQQDEGRLFE